MGNSGSVFSMNWLKSEESIGMFFWLRKCGEEGNGLYMWASTRQML
jgi:hypothetical protein